MFSERTDWPSAPNRLTEALHARRAAGLETIDLTESNPTHCGFVYPESIFTALGSKRSMRYEPDPQGLVSAREAIAGWYALRRRAVSPEKIFLTSGTSESYSLLFKLLCNPGESILAPVPSYPLIEYIARLADVRVRPYRLAYDGSWEIDAGSIVSAAGGAGPGVRAIVVVAPHNPTGHVPDDKTFGKILAVAKENGWAVIVDEVFAGYNLEGAEDETGFMSRTAADGATGAGIGAAADQPPLFFLNGLSKLAGLPQLKLGWIAVEPHAAGGETDAADIELTHRLQMLCDIFLSVNTPVQAALPEILRAGEAVRRQIHTRIRRNYSALKALLAGSPHSAVSMLNASAGWTALLRLPNVLSDEEWAIRFLEKGVLVQPGHYFDAVGWGETAAVSLLPQEERFGRGIDEILSCVGSLT